MKRIFLITLILLGCTAVMSAVQLSPSQQKAKVEIFNALKKYGTNLSDDGEETIRFTSDGIQYWVNVSAKDYDPLYITLVAGFNLPETYDTDIARIAAINAAGGMPVYVDCREGILIFDCEMYAKDAKPFIAVLPAMLKAIHKSVENFEGEYSSVIKDYSPKTSAQLGEIINTNQFAFPEVTSSKNDSKLYITNVTLGRDYTILDMTSYNGRQYQNCCINRDSYLLSNGKRYKLIKAEGISYYPQYTDYPGYETGREVSLSFKLYFSPLPENTKTFDFFEGTNDGWYIKGVKLDSEGSYNLKSETISTAYHDWECIGIQLQDGQTVLTKRVSPKDDSTFIHSSQDEYIEDADTGRKYYLVKSEIGFEGSPTILMSKKPVEFHEVYPALPSTVKRINISSGSQYYIKGLQIRK